jgi:hypothetical protein
VSVLLTIAALAMSSPALGAPVTEIVHVEGIAAVDAQPQTSGDNLTRFRTGLRLEITPHPRWSVYVAGAIRQSLPATGLDLDEADLHRLVATFHNPIVTLRAGRFVRVSVAGRTRIDGLSLDYTPAKWFRGSVWAGRVGHAEPMDNPGALGAGLNAVFTVAGVDIGGGYDARLNPVDIRHRMHLTSNYRLQTGGWIAGVAEYGLTQAWPSDPAPPAANFGNSTRAELRTQHPLGTRAQLGGSLRWVGLAQVSAPWSSLEVVETLVPRGYAVADVTVGLRPQGARVRATGGFTLYPSAEAPPRLGGTGRVAVDLTDVDAGQISVFGVGTVVGRSWYAGAGATFSTQIWRVSLSSTAAVYWFEGIDSRGGIVGEGRVQGALPLLKAVDGGQLNLIVRAGIGTDRRLSFWGRGGLALQGAFGMARRAP